MAAFHIILRNLALIHLPLLGKEVHRIALLEPGIALVLFIGQYVLNRPVLPPLFPGRCGDLLFHQVLGNGVRRLSLHEHPVNKPYNFCLLRHDLHLPVLPLLVAEERTVGDAYLAVFKPFSLSPGHIL